MRTLESLPSSVVVLVVVVWARGEVGLAKCTLGLDHFGAKEGPRHNRKIELLTDLKTVMTTISNCSAISLVWGLHPLTLKAYNLRPRWIHQTCS